MHHAIDMRIWDKKNKCMIGWAEYFDFDNFLKLISNRHEDDTFSYDMPGTNVYFYDPNGIRCTVFLDDFIEFPWKGSIHKGLVQSSVPGIFDIFCPNLPEAEMAILELARFHHTGIGGWVNGYWLADNIKVIGNRWANPELLCNLK